MKRGFVFAATLVLVLLFTFTLSTQEQLRLVDPVGVVFLELRINLSENFETLQYTEGIKEARIRKKNLVFQPVLRNGPWDLIFRAESRILDVAIASTPKNDLIEFFNEDGGRIGASDHVFDVVKDVRISYPSPKIIQLQIVLEEGTRKWGHKVTKARVEEIKEDDKGKKQRREVRYTKTAETQKSLIFQSETEEQTIEEDYVINLFDKERNLLGSSEETESIIVFPFEVDYIRHFDL